MRRWPVLYGMKCHMQHFDQIENDARGSSFQLAIQVMVYGFLTC